MKGTTHIAAGVLTALAAYKLNNTYDIYNTACDIISTTMHYISSGLSVIGLIRSPFPFIDVMASAYFTSTLPDKDQKWKFVRHRGQTHTILWPVLLIIIAYITYSPVIAGLSLGLLSHILCDLFNGKGAEIVWPFSKKNYRIADFKYDGVMENVLLVLMSIGIIVLVVNEFVDVRVIAGIK